MIIETFSTLLMGSISFYAYLQQNGQSNDSDKLNKIFSLSGLNVKDGKKTYTTQLIRKKVHPWGMEYVYRIPLSRSFKDYESRIDSIRDGLNNKPSKIKLLNLLTRKNKIGTPKEVELSYDGMLHVKVYNEPFPTEIPYIVSPQRNWRVPIGILRDGSEVSLDFEKLPHVSLGGATRYGKSNLINSIIISLLVNQPDNVKFTLIDLKGGIELSDYEHLEQTVSIAYEPEEALRSLQKAYNSMRSTQEELRSRGYKKIQGSHIGDRHFIIIDEVGELNPSEAVTKEERRLKEECQKYMSQICRLGAGLGFHMLLATQYPTGDVLNRQCKQNSDAKICFRVQSSVASRVVLDSEGAEKLPNIKGRAIFQASDKRVIIQTPLLSSQTIQDVITQYQTEVSKREVLASGETKEQEDIESEAGEYTVVIEETDFSD